MMSNKAVILCVDDERIVLDSLITQLRKEFGQHYAYEMAESADEAWEFIEELNEGEVQVLIIVSDWLMPGMKGDELLIKVHQKFPSIVKVMLTGQADKNAVDRAKKEGGLFRCLHKPWTGTELISTIREGLGHTA